MWTVPSRHRRRLSAIRRADDAIADGERRLVLGVEGPSGARSGRGRRRDSSRSHGGGRGGRLSSRSYSRRGVVSCRVQQRRSFPTYVAVVRFADVASVSTTVGVAAAILAHHIYEEFRPGELADLRRAEGLMETRERLPRDGLLLRLETLGRMPRRALLLARKRAFLRLKSTNFQTSSLR